MATSKAACFMKLETGMPRREAACWITASILGVIRKLRRSVFLSLTVATACLREVAAWMRCHCKYAHCLGQSKKSFGFLLNKDVQIAYKHLQTTSC